MKHGRATIEAYSGVPVATDEIVAQWVSLHPFGSPTPTYRPVSEGSIPLVYLESHLDADGYRDLLLGTYDHDLVRLADDIPSNAIIRWDHEMDAPPASWGREWGQMHPARYIAGWRYVTKFLGPMFWCPTSVASRWAPYFPGSRYTSHIGFDYYDHGKREPLPEALAKRIRKLQALAYAPRILLGELGSAALPDVCGRPEWLASADAVPGLWGACYFDVDRTSAEGKGTDWRMNAEMDAIWKRLP